MSDGGTEGDDKQAPAALLKSAIAASVVSANFLSREDVQKFFELPSVGVPKDHLYDRLKPLLLDASGSFDTHDLRAAGAVLQLQAAVSRWPVHEADILYVIAAGLEAGSRLKAPDDPAWIEAASIARGLLICNAYVGKDYRSLAVAGAAGRLQAEGSLILTHDRGLDPKSPALETVTAAICDRFARLGLFEVLRLLWGSAAAHAPYQFEQYLFGRCSAVGERRPSIPFGLLFNLAVKTPHTAKGPPTGTEWHESIDLARDLAAILDVEPYDGFWMINASPRRMGRLLDEVGLYDHLFSIRQWAAGLTPLLLKEFFGSAHDSKMLAKSGWTAADAVIFAANLQRAVTHSPTRLQRGDVASAELDPARLDRMLRDFSHAPAGVNVGYLSPLAAESADAMFRPLLAAGDGSFIAPCASTIGPACYETVAAAVRGAVSKADNAHLTGIGTERVVAALLRLNGLAPTFEGAKYNEGKSVDAGECDLVLEDDGNVLFVECKAKPLTRAAMAAQPAAAMLDYAGGVLASQVQAMQHERLLVDNGEIVFDDGGRLAHAGRKVTRLSITLLDHGSLMDRTLFMSFAGSLSQATLNFDAKHSNRKRYAEVNDELDRHRQERLAAERRGEDSWTGNLGAAALSVGQLAAIASECRSVSSLVDRLRVPATFGTMNPLREYRQLKQQGMFEK
ncbi:MAG: hypothetical protein ABL956_15770 [Hyphomonadaceae bacterium]